MQKVNIDIADRKAPDFRQSLVSAERLSEGAISSALSFSNTFGFKSSASELAVTSADYFFFKWVSAIALLQGRVRIVITQGAQNGSDACAVNAAVL
jgi:hypothetical protein